MTRKFQAGIPDGAVRWPWRSWGVAGFAGVLSSLAFEPVALPFAMVVGLCVLIVVCRNARSWRARHALAIGLAYGVGFIGPLIWWLRAVSEPGYVVVVAGETLLIAITVVGIWVACRLRGWPIWVAAIWVSGETLRGAFPLGGFPWGRLAHTAIDTPLDSYARLLAMPGLSFLMAFVCGLLVLAAEGGRKMRATRLVAVAGVASLLAAGFAISTEVVGNVGSRSVALIQGNVPGEFQTWPRGEIFKLHQQQTERLAASIDAGIAPQPDMVLWPENATDVDPYHSTALRSKIQKLSSRVGAPILVGGIFDGETDDTAFNAGVVWSATGPADRYVKRKLVPYGEYVPLRRVWGNLVPRIDRDVPRDMIPGTASGAIDIGRTRIADTICWDIAHDAIVREAVNDGGQLVVVQTSNAAFTGTQQPEQQWDIARMRAIETGRWVVVPSTNGISGVVDPSGDEIARAPTRDAATVQTVVELAGDRTIATVLGGYVTWLLTGVALLGLAFGLRARRSGQM